MDVLGHDPSEATIYWLSQPQVDFTRVRSGQWRNDRVGNLSIQGASYTCQVAIIKSGCPAEGGEVERNTRYRSSPYLPSWIQLFIDRLQTTLQS